MTSPSDTPLSDLVSVPAKRAELTTAAVAEVDAEVASMGGLKGTAVKAGLKAITKIKPTFVSANIDRMLPAFAAALDPHFVAGRQSGDPEAHLVANGDQIAEDMLAITDAKAAASDNNLAVGTYDKLRKSAKAQVLNAMPRLAAFVVRHGT